MKNAPTEEKKKKKKDWNAKALLAKAYPSFDEYRETQQFCLPTADPRRERGGPRNSIGRGSSTTANR